MTQQSPTSYQARLQSFAQFAQRVMQDWLIPGLAVGVVKDGEVIFAEGFGQRDREKGLAITPQTIFPIASCTKAFVAMALAMLVDEGKLDWDVPLRRYLPEFKLVDEVASERISVRDLLTHRTGVPGHDLATFNLQFNTAELLERIAHLEPNSDIRTTWQYNNLMYGVAGHVLERISGLSWDEFIRQRILEPLGMKNTSFTVQDIWAQDDYAMPYKAVAGQLRRTNFYTALAADGPAGAINSNVEDMTRWLRCLLRQGRYGDGEQRLISAEQFAQLIEPQMLVPITHYQMGQRYLEESRYHYALGWRVFNYRGHLLAQHSGGINGFTLMTTFLPDDDLGIVVLTNLEPSHALFPNIFVYNLCDRVLGLDELPWNERMMSATNELMSHMALAREQEACKPGPAAPLSHQLSAYAGQYKHPGYGVMALTVEGQGLKCLYNTMEFSFTHLHYDVFHVEHSAIELSCRASFATDEAGKIASLALPLEPAASPIVFTRVGEGNG